VYMDEYTEQIGLEMARQAGVVMERFTPSSGS